MKVNSPLQKLKPGLARWEVVGFILLITFLTAGAMVISVAWKRGGDRSANILNIRNCQQAMRGHQGMRNLPVGAPFTRRDLEEFMRFPRDIEAQHGWVFYRSGKKVTSESGGYITIDDLYPEPISNGDHLWLKVHAPLTEEYVGAYGFNDLSDTKGW